MKELAAIAARKKISYRKMEILDHARRRAQKVNLYEKVQIPGYEDAIRKIKRFLEDEENLAKSAQKIVKNVNRIKNRRYDRAHEENIFFLVHHSDYIGFLDELQAWACYVKYQETEPSEELLRRIRLQKDIRDTLALRHRIPKTEGEPLSESGGIAITRTFQELTDQQESLQQELNALQKALFLKPWELIFPRFASPSGTRRAEGSALHLPGNLTRNGNRSTPWRSSIRSSHYLLHHGYANGGPPLDRCRGDPRPGGKPP